VKTVALALAAAFALMSGRASAANVIRIDSGGLLGVAADGVTSFKGIPYAAPPVGELRWRPPAPPAPWAGVRAATAYGAICMQKIVVDNGRGAGPASEDCLTLNVFTPHVGPAGAALPVMVWIHGGGLVNGSGTAALYDGSALARQGVVVVTINYRLGRFGFFAHPALTAEQRGAALANYGLLDQVAALKWVRRNIARFGGDPRNVTIFGESAGGVSVNRLMMIRQARGLFQKAIVESGAGGEKGQTLAQAEQDGAAYAAKLGVTGPDPAKLRGIPADAMVAAGDLDLIKGEAPILDGVLLTENPAAAFATGRVARVPYLIGSNSLEFPGAYASPFLDRLIRLTPDARAKAVAAYGSDARIRDHIVSDAIFGEPARTLARDQVGHGSPAWLYRFSVVSEKAPKAVQGGAVHASDRQYVFDNLGASTWPTDRRDAAVAKTIGAYWVAFARTGNPNGPGRPAWPRYGPGDELMNFTNDGPVAERTPDAAALDLITASNR
jgi:para-nitrobenzyl esterase